MWPPQSASNAHHAAPRRTNCQGSEQRALPEPLLSTRATPIPPNTPEHKQGQGALSYFVAHLPAIPPAAAVRSKRSPTASHQTPADWPGESWHSTLLLAPADALTSTDGKSVGLPAMVGIFRRLYDWLLSLFWYVLTVIVSSFSCRLMCHVLDAVGCRLKLMMVATWHLSENSQCRAASKIDGGCDVDAEANAPSSVGRQKWISP